MVLTGIFIFCFMLIGCNNSVKDIKAQYFTITHAESMYDAINKIDAEIVDLLVNHYNEIELTGTTTEEINLANAITIIFIYDDQISGKITFDDKGISRLNDKVENYIISEDSEFYETALEVYYDVKEKYEK